MDIATRRRKRDVDRRRCVDDGRRSESLSILDVERAIDRSIDRSIAMSKGRTGDSIGDIDRSTSGVSIDVDVAIDRSTTRQDVGRGVGLALSE